MYFFISPWTNYMLNLQLKTIVFYGFSQCGGLFFQPGTIQAEEE